MPVLQFPVTPDRGRFARLRRVFELTGHLALRELRSRHRLTLLGWAWPLVRHLAQFGVLYVVFSSIFDLGIEDYAAFLFTGLIAWSWFFAAVSEGTGSILANRNLLAEPRCPAPAIPLAAVFSALADALIAVPALLLIAAASGAIHLAGVLAIVLVGIQLLLTVGAVLLTSAATVYFRDVEQIVLIFLLMLFYVTPVFYAIARVPEEFQAVLELNPLTHLIEGYRELLLQGTIPELLPLAAVAAFSAALAGGALAFFNRVRPGFLDEL